MATYLERGLENLKSSLYDTLQRGPSERLSGCRKQLDYAVPATPTHNRRLVFTLFHSLAAIQANLSSSQNISLCAYSLESS